MNCYFEDLKQEQKESVFAWYRENGIDLIEENGMHRTATEHTPIECKTFFVVAGEVVRWL